jgi:isopentenyl-diphosphate delta-isomerase
VEEKVILVNEHDEVLGLMEKMKAHQTGVLHRAFSVFVINHRNELLLQQRARTKYHSGGLWTNTCCSHQRESESNEEAAHRRLREEMGFDCELEHLFSFVYRAELDQGLTEHELDHVFLGRWDGIPDINTDEVEHYKWMNVVSIGKDIDANPNMYTEWFKIIYNRFLKHIQDESNRLS